MNVQNGILTTQFFSKTSIIRIKLQLAVTFGKLRRRLEKLKHLNGQILEQPQHIQIVW